MRVYSTTDVAKRCSAATGKHVGDEFVRHCYLAMHGLDPMGAGHTLSLTEADARLIVAYCLECYRRPSATPIREWADAHGHELPKLRKSLLPVAAKPGRAPRVERSVSDDTDRQVISRLVESVKRIEQKVEHLEKGTGAKLQLVDRVVNRMDARREKINAKVRHFAMTHPTTASDVWTWLRKRWAYLRDVEIDGPNLLDWLERTDNLTPFLLDLETMLSLYEEELNGQQRLGL